MSTMSVLTEQEIQEAIQQAVQNAIEQTLDEALDAELTAVGLQTSDAVSGEDVPFNPNIAQAYTNRLQRYGGGAHLVADGMLHLSHYLDNREIRNEVLHRLDKWQPSISRDLQAGKVVTCRVGMTQGMPNDLGYQRLQFRDMRCEATTSPEEGEALFKSYNFQRNEMRPGFDTHLLEPKDTFFHILPPPGGFETLPARSDQFLPQIEDLGRSIATGVWNTLKPTIGSLLSPSHNP